MGDTLSLDILLPRVVAFICEALDAERASVFLYDEDMDELYTRAAVGVGGELRFPAWQGIAGAVQRSGETVLIEDAYGDPRFNPDLDQATGFRTRNILCQPILQERDGRRITVGVAQVLNKRGGSFRAQDARLLRRITSQAAPAFANARLHHEIARARSEEAKLLELTSALTTELRLHPLLRKIMETVAQVMEAERATLFVHDRARDELWAVVDFGEEVRFPSHQGLAGAVFRSGETVNIPDAYADPRFNPEFDRRTNFVTRSVLCMPVVDRDGRRLAVTQVLNRRGGAFTAIDERRLRAFSAQAAIAMNNAQLFEEVERVKNYAEAVLESMSNGVVTFDAEGRVAKLNSSAARLLRSDESVLGTTARVFLAGKNAWLADAVDRVQGSGSPEVAMDVDLALSDPAVPEAFDRRRHAASVNVSLVPIAGGMGSMLVIEDITNEKRLKTTMARYMTKEVADRLLEQGPEEALGGKIQKASVLFTDIRSFTSIAEAIGPQETVRLLNEYFGLMVDVLFEHGGVLDKYIGDAIMAVFGAPVSGPDDADRAVRAAVGMLRALQDFNRRRRAMGQAPVSMGVGVNTDEVLSGNIGSLKRMEFTVIGDGVNLASRLEGANKSYGTQILISDLTRVELRQGYLMREVDRIQVKGKSRPVSVHEVLEHLEGRDRERAQGLVADFQAGLSAYRKRDWAAACAVFQGILLGHRDDGPARLYLERSRHFLQHPPPEEWDGVWVMKEK